MLTERSAHVAEHNPRILANPFEFCVAIAFFIAGLNTVNILIHYGDQPRVGLLSLSPVVLWMWIVSIMLGALLMLTGLALPGRHPTVRATEAAGLFISGAAWSSLTVVLISLDHHEWGTWMQYAAFSVAPALRLWAMWRYERGLRKAGQFIGSGE